MALTRESNKTNGKGKRKQRVPAAMRLAAFKDPIPVDRQRRKFGFRGHGRNKYKVEDLENIFHVQQSDESDPTSTDESDSSSEDDIVHLKDKSIDKRLSKKKDIPGNGASTHKDRSLQNNKRSTEEQSDGDLTDMPLENPFLTSKRKSHLSNSKPPSSRHNTIEGNDDNENIRVSPRRHGNRLSVDDTSSSKHRKTLLQTSRQISADNDSDSDQTNNPIPNSQSTSKRKSLQSSGRASTSNAIGINVHASPIVHHSMSRSKSKFYQPSKSLNKEQDRLMSEEDVNNDNQTPVSSTPIQLTDKSSSRLSVSRRRESTSTMTRQQQQMPASVLRSSKKVYNKGKKRLSFAVPATSDIESSEDEYIEVVDASLKSPHSIQRNSSVLSSRKIRLSTHQSALEKKRLSFAAPFQSEESSEDDNINVDATLKSPRSAQRKSTVVPSTKKKTPNTHRSIAIGTSSSIKSKSTNPTKTKYVSGKKSTSKKRFRLSYTPKDYARGSFASISSSESDNDSIPLSPPIRSRSSSVSHDINIPMEVPDNMDFDMSNSSKEDTQPSSHEKLNSTNKKSIRSPIRFNADLSDSSNISTDEDVQLPTVKRSRSHSKTSTDSTIGQSSRSSLSRSRKSLKNNRQSNHISKNNTDLQVSSGSAGEDPGSSTKIRNRSHSKNSTGSARTLSQSSNDNQEPMSIKTHSRRKKQRLNYQPPSRKRRTLQKTPCNEEKQQQVKETPPEPQEHEKERSARTLSQSSNDNQEPMSIKTHSRHKKQRLNYQPPSRKRRTLQKTPHNEEKQQQLKETPPEPREHEKENFIPPSPDYAPSPAITSRNSRHHSIEQANDNYVDEEEHFSDVNNASDGVSAMSEKKIQHQRHHQKKKKSKKPKHKNFIQGLEEDDTEGPRRSKRNRVQRLHNNEQIKYKRDENGLWEVANVVQLYSPYVPRLTKEERIKYNMRSNKKNRKLAKTSKTSKRKLSKDADDDLTTETNFEEEIAEELADYEEVSNPWITCRTTTGNEIVERDCVRTAAMWNPQPIFQNPDDVSPALLIDRYSMNGFSAGVIIIKPLKDKGEQQSDEHNVSFFITHGIVRLTIHETSLILREHAHFFVPAGNLYNISNISKTKDAEVMFTRTKAGID